MSDDVAAEGMNIADAIAEFISDNTDMEIMPMVGGFTLIAEMIDPSTGQQALFTLHDETLSPWVEYGMLASRLSELTAEMQMQAMGEVYEEWDDD